MTYPQIGNVGTNAEDEESRRPFLSGFVVKELFAPSSWRSRETLDAYLLRHGVPGLAEIDTRALVRRIRDGGAQVAVLSTDPARQDEASSSRSRAPMRGSRGATSPPRSAATRRTAGARDGGRASRGRCRAHRARRRPAGSSPTTSGSSATSCACSWSRASTCTWCPRRDGRRGARARARCRVPVQRPGRSAAVQGIRAHVRRLAQHKPCSGSASATRSSVLRSAARRASSSSDTTAAISPAKTSRPARSRSAPRTTVMRSTPTRCAQRASQCASRTST